MVQAVIHSVSAFCPRIISHFNREHTPIDFLFPQLSRHLTGLFHVSYIQFIYWSDFATCGCVCTTDYISRPNEAIEMRLVFWLVGPISAAYATDLSAQSGEFYLLIQTD